MNDTIALLRNRKSMRAFESRPIDASVKDEILNAALQAPTAGNQILYTILDIEDQAIKDTLARTCDNQPFIADAPMVLIFLADCRRWLDSYRCAGAECRDPDVADLLIACEDALIAAQNTVVAAESLGIGSCYIGDILENRDEHVALLHLDKYVLPIAMLVFGYPTEQQKKRDKPKRFDKKYIVQKNRYSRLTETEIRNMFAEQHSGEAFDFDAKLKAFCERKYMSAFALEMSRSVAQYLDNFRK